MRIRKVDIYFKPNKKMNKICKNMRYRGVKFLSLIPNVNGAKPFCVHVQNWIK